MNFIKISNQSEIKNNFIKLLNPKNIYVEAISEKMALQSFNQNHPYFQREVTARVLHYFISKKITSPKEYNLHIDVLSALKNEYKENAWDLAINIYVEDLSSAK